MIKSASLKPIAKRRIHSMKKLSIVVLLFILMSGITNAEDERNIGFWEASSIINRDNTMERYLDSFSHMLIQFKCNDEAKIYFFNIWDYAFDGKTVEVYNKRNIQQFIEFEYGHIAEEAQVLQTLENYFYELYGESVALILEIQGDKLIQYDHRHPVAFIFQKEVDTDYIAGRWDLISPINVNDPPNDTNIVIPYEISAFFSSIRSNYYLVFEHDGKCYEILEYSAIHYETEGKGLNRIKYISGANARFRMICSSDGDRFMLNSVEALDENNHISISLLKELEFLRIEEDVYSFIRDNSDYK